MLSWNIWILWRWLSFIYKSFISLKSQRSSVFLKCLHFFLHAVNCYYFQTLFRASLPHPTSDCDFAQYEINMLIPGIDLFSDRYRADVSTVVASLNFLIFELHCAKQNLTVSISLWYCNYYIIVLDIFMTNHGSSSKISV